MCVKVGQWKLANRRITIAADPGTISEFQSEIVPGSRDSEFHVINCLSEQIKYTKTAFI